mmetsp:Transcript_11497/g.26157  ORF Transcript_11497/g.26157 Transcript_11497/m.26157 type:complete len:214 (+) Transcript_11497:803-1444(+)
MAMLPFGALLLSRLLEKDQLVVSPDAVEVTEPLRAGCPREETELEPFSVLLREWLEGLHKGFSLLSDLLHDQDCAERALREVLRRRKLELHLVDRGVSHVLQPCMYGAAYPLPSVRLDRISVTMDNERARAAPKLDAHGQKVVEAVVFSQLLQQPVPLSALPGNHDGHSMSRLHVLVHEASDLLVSSPGNGQQALGVGNLLPAHHGHESSQDP